MRVSLFYGLYAGLGLFAVSAWSLMSSLSGGSLPGANGASGAVMAPMMTACFMMVAYCLARLIIKEAR